MIDVSIVIVCMNRLDNLYPCLQSIREHCKLDYEILVVAYLFSPDNLAAAQRDFPWVQFIESKQIRGFSENNNLALQRARGRYCFILNDDTQMQSDVIAQLLRDFSLLPPSAAIVTPRLVNSDGSLQLCGRPPYPAYKYVLQQWHLYREPIDNTLGRNCICINYIDDSREHCCDNIAINNETPELYQTSNISGAAFLIKTEVFRQLGWFDERYFFTPEDIALSTLARERGYTIYVDKAASIIHKWRTTASKIAVAVRPASIRGSLIFFSRDSNFRYLLLGLGVWTAEWAKYIKSSILLKMQTGLQAKLQLDKATYRANCRAIFTHKSPKELFIENRP